jgi:hypothetical protein
MAAPTNSFQTYQAVGDREDLEDVIYSISPVETPFMTMAARSKATAVLHEWQTDALAAAAGNKDVEGNDANSGNGSTSTPTSRLGMYCQISSKYAVISDTQQAVDKAGRSSEMSYQIAKRLGELKRDMEFACLNHQGSSAGSATVARSTASVESWLTNPTGSSMAGNSTDIGITPTGYTTPGWTSGGSILAPTDATVNGTLVVGNLKAVIAACWTAGGNPGIILAAAGIKQQISGFAGIATIYREAGTTAKGTAIVGAADLYISDFGEHRVVPDRFCKSNQVLILDMDYWSIGYLRPVRQIEIARTGASMKRFIDVEFCLIAKNPQSSGKISSVVP